MAETEDGIRELHKEIFSLYKELMDDQILHSSAGTRFVTIEAATTAAKNLKKQKPSHPHPQTNMCSCSSVTVPYCHC